MSTFGRSKSRQHAGAAATDHGLVEPSEVRFRKWAMLLILIITPPLLFFIYYKTMFPGLTNPDALDYAQVARNVHAGRGLTTLNLRPLAMTHGVDPLRQPDLTHGPLFPILVAIAFGLVGVKDSTAALVSGLFYMLTIPAVYLMAKKLFSSKVALVTTFVIAVNSLILEYAASALPYTLMIFLMTVLLYAIYNLAPKDDAGQPSRLPLGYLILAGSTAALLYLTDPIFAWFVPVVLGSVLWLRKAQRVKAALFTLVPMLVLAGPWMIRNLALGVDPIFGLRSAEILMHTKSHFPGTSGYMLSREEFIGGPGIMSDIALKMLAGLGQIIEGFPQMTANWILAFFLPCMLFRFSNQGANALRRITLLGFLALVCGMLLFNVEMPLFVTLLPTMMVFAVAFMIYLLEQAKLPRNSVALTAALIGLAVAYPFYYDLFHMTRPVVSQEAVTAASMAKVAGPKDLIFTDQPALVAWYSNRPAELLPTSDATTKATVSRIASARWVLLTERVQAMDKLAPTWTRFYKTVRPWNDAYAKAILAKTEPPQAWKLRAGADPFTQALDGFTAVPPFDNSPLSTVVAGRMDGEQRVGLR